MNEHDQLTQPARPSGSQSTHGTQGAPGVQASQGTQVQGSQGSSTDLHGLDSWLTDRIVTLIVGAEEKRWVVHEKLLVSQSEVFRDYFAGGDDEMKLPDDDPRLFALFIRWLYGTAFLPSGGARNFRFLAPDGTNLTVRDYLGVYVMGGKFGILGVRNAVLDVLYMYFGEASDDHRAPDMGDITYIFDHTGPNAPMRRFLTAHALFFLFSKNRRGLPLPQDWNTVLNEYPQVGFEMITMLSEWNWTMGYNSPRMTIKPRHEFHERPSVPKVKQEDEADGAASR
ncbi:hypothetical protein F5144DRAFT_482089 [Chaetomium tenue]|uniref:Uncharacterized protein n=1 Tax=Chaetomium tenue TaxID=1854479 RepID=A0ACB7PFE7_9PEZI|nr:hypothetical protein F5144DRAFT_482089 [Chaetomium globosum]